MAIVVPTITAENPHVYREQIERVQNFAKRIHIDLMDGIFTPNKSVNTAQVWWPEVLQADIHIMHEHPLVAIDSLLTLKPNLIVVQAECKDDLLEICTKVRAAGVKIGISLLADTLVSEVEDILSEIDQLLIFSGNLGYQGGSSVDFSLLEKVTEAKVVNPLLEIAWDGGLNDVNIQNIAEAGIDVLNVGGYIHTAKNPELAYTTLCKLIA